MPQSLPNQYRYAAFCGDGDLTFNPTIIIQRPIEQEMSNVLRRAFAFFRRHDDGRYSANSKMDLLRFADKLDEYWQNDIEYDASEFPDIAYAEVPFSYDEETEVKTGGVVGMVIVLPGGRTMLAVHQEKRRARVGQALLITARDAIRYELALWIHRTNLVAQHFAISDSLGFMPFTVNRLGAVQYSMNPPVEDSDAVEFCDDRDLDAMLRSGRRRQLRQSNLDIAPRYPSFEEVQQAVAPRSLTEDQRQRLRLMQSPLRALEHAFDAVHAEEEEDLVDF